MTTEPVEAQPAEPAAAPAAEPKTVVTEVRPVRRRPSGKVVLAVAGAFVAGAVCTGCLGVAALFVAGHGDDHHGFDGDHPKIERVFPDRGGWKGGEKWPGDGGPWQKQEWPGPQDKGIWPLPDDRPGLPGVPAPEQKVPSPAPSATS
ncbi:hypothetical protein [Catellatospora vulcania]|uniref:hypothetical protein n=1 Tax=Catellatospora vulcania TaxID=1460450 RepID=UPI0012D37D13|nr:hypothetical protein [Catellatospora vulcania]